MLPELQRQFDLVESHRADLQRAVLALSDEQLNRTPAPGAWSVRLTVQHLVLSDETVGRVGAGGAEGRMFRVLPRVWRRALVLSALRRDRTLPLPSPAVEPVGDVPLAELLGRWDAARADMSRALDGLGANETPYSHPVLGPLTGAQMLDLSLAHMAYHGRQIAALAAKIGR